MAARGFRDWAQGRHSVSNSHLPDDFALPHANTDHLLRGQLSGSASSRRSGLRHFRIQKLFGLYCPSSCCGIDGSLLSQIFSSAVAGAVSFLLATIIGVTFGILVFSPVPGGVVVGIQLVIVGVNVLGNAVLVASAGLPCVVVTADNGVIAPIVADVVVRLAREIDDPDALRSTAVAGVSLACTIFGLVQLVLVKFQLVRVVQYLPYSIPMGFLSGIGLELCSGITLAGCWASQAAALAFALTLAIGGWQFNINLAVLFPTLLIGSVAAFYACGGPAAWLLEIEGVDNGSSSKGLWEPSTVGAVEWGLLFQHGSMPLVVLCTLGTLQNCLFAEIYAKAPALEYSVEPNQVMFEFGQSFTLGGLFGFCGGFHNMACFSLGHELKAFSKSSGVIVVLFSCLLWQVGLKPLLLVPRFVFAGLLVWIGLKFLRAYLLQPAKMLPPSERMTIVCIMVIMKLFGFCAGVFTGLAMAFAGIISELAALGCVQHVSSGVETRSNVMRSLRAEQLLLQNGHKVLVLSLAPGFVFFATSAQIQRIIEQKLKVAASPWQALEPSLLQVKEETSDDESDVDAPDHNSQAPLTDVVIDFTLCKGFDGSLVVLLQRLAALGARTGFELRLAGLRLAGFQAQQFTWLKSHSEPGVVSFFPDVDRALECVEEQMLLRSKASNPEKEERRRPLALLAPARQISHENEAEPLLDGDEWVLLFLYSDRLASSRILRSTIAQAMTLVQGLCRLVEASVDKCPGLVEMLEGRRWEGATAMSDAKKLGSGPNLLLLRKGMLFHSFDVDDVGPAKGSAGSTQAPKVMGTGVAAGAAELAGTVDRRIRILNELLGTPSHAVGEFRSASKPRKSRSKDSVPDLPMWLELAGLQPDGPLLGLAAYVRGRRNLSRGEVLYHKATTPPGVFFVVNGFLSLWNEGRQDDQDMLGPLHPSPKLQRRPMKGRGLPSHTATDSSTPCVTSAVNGRERLARGTSRVLRVGPGWMLGSYASPKANGLRPVLVPLTCLAETSVSLLELPPTVVRELQETDPSLALILTELCAHFSALVMQQMAAQLSDWHSQVFSQPHNLED